MDRNLEIRRYLNPALATEKLVAPTINKTRNLFIVMLCFQLEFVCACSQLERLN